MAERYRGNRPATRRQPLTEITNGANSSPAPRALPKYAAKYSTSSPAPLPHNESFAANGSLAVRKEPVSSPGHKRIAQITSDTGRESKRNSAVSTTSTASGRKLKTYIGPWSLGMTIGHGGCSRVRLVRHKYTRMKGAVKIISRSTAEHTRAQSLANLIEAVKNNASPPNPTGFKPIPYGLEREIAVMKLLQHENIVRLFDVWENSNELYLIMEHVEGGELFGYVEARKTGVPENETIFIFRQIIAALLYCHRMHICHRDLKPENILIDPDKLQVKLIDFGMAALQADGKLLTTPCGSPHYAAPEVVGAKPYDGKLADVWSCGVILYVMLTGSTPFNYGENNEIRGLFKDIAKARFFMPEYLSAEAKDLIRRIFVVDPRERITTDELWDHPLLHKYDREFGYVGPEGSKEMAIGPAPKLEDWTIQSPADVDREILHNMRTLWHGEPESSLLKKLTNRDINQEKLFYAALLKHREEHLENYIGDPDGMGYSASDYHHSRTPRVMYSQPLPLDRQQRSMSQYSILNDEHLRSSNSFVEPPPSMHSYDPYRSSRDPMIVHHNDQVEVVVHRNGSSSLRKASINRSLRHPNSLRVEMLKQGKGGSSSYSSLTRSARSRGSLHRSSMSKNSLLSAAWPSSPPVIATMRPSDVHKRGVSFGHIRRSSTASGLASQDSSQVLTPATPQLPTSTKDRHGMKTNNSLNVHTPSPTAHVQQMIRSRKDKKPTLETPRIKVRKPDDTPTQHMRSEVRKHSVELEKACQEAFFRDSVGSGLTAKTSISDKVSPYDTPPSSISRKSATFDKALPLSINRPLPDLPKDTPNTYLQRTLDEAKEKLAAYKANGDDNGAKFDEVMKILEKILPETRTPEKRLVSAPEARTPDHLGGYMPIISEESDQRSSRDGHGLGNWRSVTDPTPLDRRVQKRKEKQLQDKTIRMVPASSPAAVAPLNVRKSGSSVDNDIGTPSQRPHTRFSHGHGEKNRGPEPLATLDAIDEDPVSEMPTAVRKKKSGWFGLARKTPELDAVPSRPNTPSTALDFNERISKRSSIVLNKLQHEKPLPMEPPTSAVSSEFPMRKKRFGGGKHGFSKWLGRKGADSKNEEGDTTGKSKSISSLLIETILIALPQSTPPWGTRPWTRCSLPHLHHRRSPVPLPPTLLLVQRALGSRVSSTSSRLPSWSA
jgi:serine/threonine-protein kinase HSL1 (negative regulator of Swe1 kinase)